MHYTLRACQPQDEAFLRRVYAAVRAEEMAMIAWSAEQADAFLRMQFDAQHQHYHQHNPEADFDVIEVDGEPVGRLYVQRGAQRIHVIDIALLPAWRGRGLGTQLLQALQQQGPAVSIHVEVNNPAQSLYQRLGFKEISTSGLYRLMEWRASATAQHYGEPA